MNKKAYSLDDDFVPSNEVVNEKAAPRKSRDVVFVVTNKTGDLVRLVFSGDDVSKACYDEAIDRFHRENPSLGPAANVDGPFYEAKGAVKHKQGPDRLVFLTKKEKGNINGFAAEVIHIANMPGKCYAIFSKEEIEPEKRKQMPKSGIFSLSEVTFAQNNA